MTYSVAYQMKHTSCVNHTKFAYPLMVRPPQFGSRTLSSSSSSSTLKTPVVRYFFPRAMKYPTAAEAFSLYSFNELNATRCSSLLALMEGDLKGMITTHDNSL